MLSQQLVARIQVTGQFFARSTRCFTDADSTFAPERDVYSVAAQIEHVAEAKACNSLADARAHMVRSIESACAVIDGLVDHTAHHRGALTVYARLLGKTADMPYG